jgi:lysophospholipase L1-like esterase
LIVSAALLLVGCSSSDPTSTPSVPTWDIVLMGDSVWLQPEGRLQFRLEEELGVDLVMHEWINPDISKHGENGGERSGDLLVRLRTDQDLRQDLREAEIIGFDVPTGLTLDVCAGDPSTATRAEVKTCMDTAVKQYQDDVTAIFEEVVALRDPADAIIRSTTVWQFWMPTFKAAGTYDVMRPRWQAMNQATLRAAAQHNITVLPAYDTFSGPDGSRDPVAAGDLEGDEFHLSPQGVERFVDLFLASGLPAVGAQ